VAPAAACPASAPLEQAVAAAGRLRLGVVLWVSFGDAARQRGLRQSRVFRCGREGSRASDHRRHSQPKTHTMQNRVDNGNAQNGASVCAANTYRCFSVFPPFIQTPQTLTDSSCRELRARSMAQDYDARVPHHTGRGLVRALLN
jgi:hypothetical protein